MNWIFEIYGDTYKALSLLPSSLPRRKSGSSFDAEPMKPDSALRRTDD
jgi:hypothetical protein